MFNPFSYTPLRPVHLEAKRHTRKKHTPRAVRQAKRKAQRIARRINRV